MHGETDVELAQRLVNTPLVLDPDGTARVAEGLISLRTNDFPEEVLYTVLLDGRDLADIDDFPVRWTRAAYLGEVLAPDGQVPLNARSVARWAHIVCVEPSTEPAAVVAALGIRGTLTVELHTTAVEPPPFGMQRCEVVLLEDRFSAVQMRLDEPMSRTQLEQVLGRSWPVPRVRADGPHLLAHWIDAFSAPFSCDVFAAYPPDGDPGPDSLAFEVLLRRATAR